MYTSARTGIGQSYTRLSSVQYVPVGDNGQSWALSVRPTALFDATVDQAKSFLVLVMGTLISLMFFGASRNLVHERIAAVRAREQSVRQLEQQTANLEESEARFKLLTSHIRNHAIVLLDPTGTITTWNEGAEKLFGYRADEIVGKPLQVLSAESDAITSMTLALEHGQYEATSQRRRRDGSTFLGLKQLFPVHDEHGRCIGYAMIMRDVTAERAAEKELNDAKTQAESASAAKSAFVANISHELRTPMNAVLGVSQILARTPLNAEQRQYLDMVSGAGRSLLALLNDVLDFSKIEANKLELADDDFLVDDVLCALAAVMAMTSAEKGLALSMCVEAEVPVSLHGDVQRIQQVLLNLVSNALKFTDSGTVGVHVGRDPAQPGMLRWEVRDTGIGISPEQLQRLFSPFSQADASAPGAIDGRGDRGQQHAGPRRQLQLPDAAARRRPARPVCPERRPPSLARAVRRSQPGPARRRGPAGGPLGLALRHGGQWARHRRRPGPLQLRLADLRQQPGRRCAQKPGRTADLRAQRAACAVRRRRP
jgi:PAS domain S-box-containing protein